MPRAGRQVLGSLVVNVRPRVRRSEADALRAVLHNCVRHGPSSQDRGDRPDFRAQLIAGWAGSPSTTPCEAPGYAPSWSGSTGRADRFGTDGYC